MPNDIQVHRKVPLHNANILQETKLAFPEWNGANIWYMYRFMKLQSFMMSNTLYVVLHIPLVNKSL